MRVEVGEVACERGLLRFGEIERGFLAAEFRETGADLASRRVAPIDLFE